MKRSRAYFRYQRKRHIQRKIGILRGIGGDEYVRSWCQGKPGKFSKGKIHCSCWMCRSKSYDTRTIMDQRAIISGDQQIKDFYMGQDQEVHNG